MPVQTSSQTQPKTTLVMVNMVGIFADLLVTALSQEESLHVVGSAGD